MVDVTDKVIFLSGPITGKEHNNVAAFAVAAERLRAAGAAYVYNPAHKSSNAHSEKRIRMTHGDYLLDTIHELTKREKRSQTWEWVIPRKYDMLVLLDGWEDSNGARMERAVALSCNIPVYELADVLG